MTGDCQKQDTHSAHQDLLCPFNHITGTDSELIQLLSENKIGDSPASHLYLKPGSYKTWHHVHGFTTRTLLTYNMTTDINTRTQSPTTPNLIEALQSPMIEACMNWTSISVPNSTAFDPSGSSKLSYHASTSVTCDNPENAHFRFSLYLTGSESPDGIQDPTQSQTFLAYTGKVLPQQS